MTNRKISEYDQMLAELVERWKESSPLTQAMLTELLCQLETKADETGRALSSMAAKFAMLGVASVQVAIESEPK